MQILSGKTIYPIAIVLGALWATVFYAIAGYLRNAIGVAVWEHSLPLTLLYGIVLAVSVLPWQFLRFSAKPIFLHILGVSFACAFFAYGTVVGPSTGLLVSAGFSVVAMVTRLIVGGVGNWQYSSLTESFVIAIATAAFVVSAWMIGTAPAYAEGFVVLSSILIGAFHLLLILGSAVVFRALEQNGSPRKIGALRTISAISVSTIVPMATLFYVLLAEGEQPTTLEPPGEWKNAFVALDTPSSFEPLPDVDPGFSKAALIELLQRSDELPYSHIATLFLLTGEQRWAVQFKNQILDAARKNLFTGPEGSIKYGQRFAMLWAIYYREIANRLPNLFASDEQAIIEEWFTAIVEKIFEPGWVDYLYAIPFRALPHGPYLNQEIGAGAVAALLPFVNPENVELTERANAFLNCCAVGWRRNFRNQDDSYKYQDVWMGSAYSLHRYADSNQLSLSPGMRSAVEWVKSQLPLNAFPLQYGLTGNARPLDSLAIGAFVLGDPESRWLLNRQLQEIAERGGRISDKEIVALWLWDDSVVARPYFPRDTLLYGSTGYTFRPGVLKADKLVFQRPDSMNPGNEIYALINLRNSGWHRYPATNSLVRLARGKTQILEEDIIRKYHKWLPAGRASHRDKKIDRTRLNALKVARSGLDAWVGRVTSVYSRWRQDGPEFASVSIWQSVEDVSAAKTQTLGPDNLEHTRWYVMNGNRQFVVFDQVSDKSERAKEVSWNLVAAQQDANDVWFVQGPGSARNYISVVGDGNVAVTAAQRQTKEKPAYKGVETNLRIAGTSHSGSFSVLTTISFGSNQKPKLSLVPGNSAEITTAIVDLGTGTSLVFSRGGSWDFGGIQSDAKFAKIASNGGRRTVSVIAATRVQYDSRSEQKVSIAVPSSAKDPAPPYGAGRQPITLLDAKQPTTSTFIIESDATR